VDPVIDLGREPASPQRVRYPHRQKLRPGIDDRPPSEGLNSKCGRAGLRPPSPEKSFELYHHDQHRHTLASRRRCLAPGWRLARGCHGFPFAVL
jgi:hypothetical protein